MQIILINMISYAERHHLDFEFGNWALFYYYLATCWGYFEYAQTQKPVFIDPSLDLGFN